MATTQTAPPPSLPPTQAPTSAVTGRPSVQRQREAAAERFRPLTAEEFRAMGNAGIIPRDERVELIDGVMYRMFAINPPHNALIDYLDEEVREILKRRYHVRCQGAVEPDPNSQPQPDLAIARRRDDRYAGAHPDSETALLLIEVADSSLRHDTEVKAPAYGRDGVAETWVVSVPGRELLQYTGPCEDGYRSVVTHPAGARVTATAVPELTLDTGAMFAILPR